VVDVVGLEEDARVYRFIKTAAKVVRICILAGRVAQLARRGRNIRHSRLAKLHRFLLSSPLDPN